MMSGSRVLLIVAAALTGAGVLRVSGLLSPLPSRFCTTWLHLDCVGGDKALVSTKVRVRYTYTESGLKKNEAGPTLFDNDEDQRVYNLSYPFQNFRNETPTSVEYSFEQLEHGGGDCNCVYIYIDCMEKNRYV